MSWGRPAFAIWKGSQAGRGTAAVAALALQHMATWLMGRFEGHTTGSREGLGWHRHWLSGKAQKLSSLDIACDGDLADGCFLTAPQALEKGWVGNGTGTQIGLVDEPEDGNASGDLKKLSPAPR